MTTLIWRGPLVEWRERAELTLDEAARRLGVTPYLLSQWEQRVRDATPPATVLARMCQVYGISRRAVFNDAIVEVA